VPCFLQLTFDLDFYRKVHDAVIIVVIQGNSALEVYADAVLIFVGSVALQRSDIQLFKVGLLSHIRAVVPSIGLDAPRPEE
jgi:hypothetical protein